MKVITREALSSPCPMPGREARTTCIGLVQTRWYDSSDAHTEQLREGVSACAGAGANVVFLPELTLSRYPADRRPEGPADASAEDLESGPSLTLARELAETVTCTCRSPSLSAPGQPTNAVSTAPSLLRRTVNA
mgnify:CR=1 FL=1